MRLNKATPALGTESGPFFFRRPGAVYALCLISLFVVLFRGSFNPAKVLFSNDGPLGAENAAYGRGAQTFLGIWQDSNALGANLGSAAPDLTSAVRVLIGPLAFSKFYAFFTLLFLGGCSWFFFRQSGLAPPAAFLGGLAVALNSGYFSASCWGVGPQTVCVACNFLALAALASRPPPWPALRYVFAGLALGMGVMEGADIGALYSLSFAAFTFYAALVEEGPLVPRTAGGVGRVAVVACCAGLIAAQSLNSLISTNIKGISGAQQDTRSKEERWDWATQWSSPPTEMISMIVPGFFGFRMDTPMAIDACQDWYSGGVYWGRTGRDPAWDRYFANSGAVTRPNPNSQFIRYTGGGGYASVLVVMIALWAGFQALRGKDSIFTLNQRKLLWFWMAAGFVALLLAFGRHAPFYRLFYQLPYFSTMRNPAKFGHISTFAMLVLFGYGLHGLWLKYMQVPATGPAGLTNRLSSWWSKASVFDKRWIKGCAIFFVASLLGWLIYANSRSTLEKYLQDVLFDETSAHEVAGFSIRQVGFFIFILTLSLGLLVLILTGFFSGPRARRGAILLGILLVADLSLANQPWMIHWDYKQKYATNPIIEQLRERPYEHRVALLPEWISSVVQLSDTGAQMAQRLNGLYDIEWKQHLFLYYDIQTPDIIQMPRVPQDWEAYKKALAVRSGATLGNAVREWQLTNTRYLLGMTVFSNLLNSQFDAGQGRFRVAQRFNIVPKPGISRPTIWQDMTAEPNPNGDYAVFEFTGALPRAKLYSNWQVVTNDQKTLEQLASPTFDPAQTVLVADPLQTAPATATNQPAGTVDFVSYTSKKIALKTKADTATVMLLNDKYDPDWKALVDGKPATLLRCNFIVQGVQLAAGQHTVELRFEPQIGLLWVSLGTIVLGLALLGIVIQASRVPGREGPPVGREARHSNAAQPERVRV